MTHPGKIGQLTDALRTKLNLRMLDGQLGPDILPWLNAVPEVRDLLKRKFGGKKITPMNLSYWKRNGFAEWKNRRDRLDHTRELARYSVEIAKAGGKSLTEGAAAILSGRILDVMEQIDALARQADDAQPATGKAALKAKGDRLALIAESIEGLTLSVSRLRKGDQGAENLELLREKLKQSAETLTLEKMKFQRTTCELFLQWAEDQRALDIARGGGSTEVKTEALGRLMFGDLWEPEKPKGKP